MLHYFDYLKEQNEIRNDLFTNMIQQAGHDKTLFDSTTRNSLGELTSAEYVFQRFWVPFPHNGGIVTDHRL